MWFKSYFIQITNTNIFIFFKKFNLKATIFFPISVLSKKVCNYTTILHTTTHCLSTFMKQWPNCWGAIKFFFNNFQALVWCTAIAHARTVTCANQEKGGVGRQWKVHCCTGWYHLGQILNSSSRINFIWFSIINLDWFFLPSILIQVLTAAMLCYLA